MGQPWLGSVVALVASVIAVLWNLAFNALFERWESRQAVRGRSMAVQPGMTAQVDVRTGERTVLQYLTKPIVKTLSESLHER